MYIELTHAESNAIWRLVVDELNRIHDDDKKCVEPSRQEMVYADVINDIKNKLLNGESQCKSN